MLPVILIRISYASNKELNPFTQEPVSIANKAEKETPKASLPMKDMLDPVVNRFSEQKHNK